MVLDIALFAQYGTDQGAVFLHGLAEKRDLPDTLFLVDGAQWFQEALRRHGLRFQHETRGSRNAIEHLYKEIKRRTGQLSIISATPIWTPPKHGYSPKPSAKISSSEQCHD